MRDGSAPSDEEAGQTPLYPAAASEADLWRREAADSSGTSRERPATRRIRALRANGTWVEKGERRLRQRGTRIDTADLAAALRMHSLRIVDQDAGSYYTMDKLEALAEAEEREDLTTSESARDMRRDSPLRRALRRRGPVLDVATLIVQNRATPLGWASLSDSDSVDDLTRSARMSGQARKPRPRRTLVRPHDGRASRPRALTLPCPASLSAGGCHAALFAARGGGTCEELRE